MWANCIAMNFLWKDTICFRFWRVRIGFEPGMAPKSSRSCHKLPYWYNPVILSCCSQVLFCQINQHHSSASATWVTKKKSLRPLCWNNWGRTKTSEHEIFQFLVRHCRHCLSPPLAFFVGRCGSALGPCHFWIHASKWWLRCHGCRGWLQNQFINSHGGKIGKSLTQRFELELYSWCNMPHVRLGGDTLHQEVRCVHVQGTEQNTMVFMCGAIAEVEWHSGGVVAVICSKGKWLPTIHFQGQFASSRVSGRVSGVKNSHCLGVRSSIISIKILVMWMSPLHMGFWVFFFQIFKVKLAVGGGAFLLWVPVAFASLLLTSRQLAAVHQGLTCGGTWYGMVANVSLFGLKHAIYLFIHPSMRPFIHPCIRLLIHSFMHACINSLIHSFIHSFNQSINHSFMYPFVLSNAYLPLNTSKCNCIHAIVHNGQCTVEE